MPHEEHERYEAERQVERALGLCAGDGRAARTWARPYFEGLPKPEYVEQVLHDLINYALDALPKRGWLPSDLVQAMRRKADGDTVQTLCAALQQQAERSGPDLPRPWREELPSLPADGRSPYDATVVELLAVAAVLRSLPPIVAIDIAPPVVDSGGSKHLARVRALLAKAESTTFDEEADALVSKAQELISKYSLETALNGAAANGNSGIVARRMWLDAPYLEAKSALVHAVAVANRSRSVFQPAFGFVTLVGSAADVEAVEILVTSLLTQAESAMRAHRPTTGPGPIRTKSFRRAFLLSFATRIGQRLREAGESVLSDVDDRLLPVLADREAQVEARTDELFPRATTSRSAPINNLGGWYAGKAAADLARLNNRGEVQS